MAVDWSQCKPVKTYEQVDLDLFRRTIQPAQKPAILRGLVSDWPIVQAGLISDQEVCTYVARHATEAPANCFFAPPEIKGRFGYWALISAIFNFDVTAHAQKETSLIYIFCAGCAMLKIRPACMQEPYPSRSFSPPCL